MEAYDLLVRAAGASGDGKRKGLRLPSLFASDLLLGELLLRDLLLAPLTCRIIRPPTLHWHSERDGISGSDSVKVTVTPG